MSENDIFFISTSVFAAPLPDNDRQHSTRRRHKFHSIIRGRPDKLISLTEQGKSRVERYKLHGIGESNPMGGNASIMINVATIAGE